MAMPHTQFAVKHSAYGPPVVQEPIANGKESFLWAEEESLVLLAGFIAIRSDKSKLKNYLQISDVWNKTYEVAAICL